MSCVEHVISEEKYECELLNVVVMESRMLVWRVCCDVFCGFLFVVLFLYLLYNHIISVSNDCGGRTKLCVLYMAMLYFFHSHFSLMVEMVVRYLSVLSYMWVISFCVCMVSLLVIMSFSGLHSSIEI